MRVVIKKMTQKKSFKVKSAAYQFLFNFDLRNHKPFIYLFIYRKLTGNIPYWRI